MSKSKDINNLNSSGTPVVRESFVNESALQSHSPTHEVDHLFILDDFRECSKDLLDIHEHKVGKDGSEFYLEDYKSTYSEIESYFSAQSINYSFEQSTLEGRVVDHASVTSLITEAVDASEFYVQNHESHLSEIESYFSAESIDHSYKQSAPERRVVDHRCGTTSSIEAGCSCLETGDDFGHQAVPQHGDGNPYPCNVCGKTFKSKSTLGRHLSSHYNKRPHCCDICKKTFKEKWHLRQHKLLHSDETPHKCHICNRRFKRKGNLEIHRLLHSDETPHKCHICNRRFKRKGNLVIHKLSHSDERPHKCHICNKSFKTTGNLVRHKLIHSDKKRHR